MMRGTLHRLLLGGNLLALASAMGSTLAFAGTEVVPVGANTEAHPAVTKAAPLFSVSVDGQHVSGTKLPDDAQRKTDLALEDVDIQVKFDGLDVKPVLNVSTFPPRRMFHPGERIHFLASSNYPAWISRSEIRIFHAGDDPTGKPAFTVAVSKEGGATWQAPAQLEGKYFYVLRVYDAEGHFDETKPLTIGLSQHDQPAHEPADEAVAPGYGEDRTAFRNIPVYGGAVTVYGRSVPAGHRVRVLGSDVPVDQNNAFVVQRILPPGKHDVDVAVLGGKKRDNGFEFNRAINIPSSEWFYVGLADLTVGHNFPSGNIEAVAPGEFKNVYANGRLAFYVKGKIKGQYLLTAAADTGEAALENLFTGFDGKDPRQFLRRIDPNAYYPVYGDDSTMIEDAPTSGKFFVRIARGDSHAQWGNFKTEIKGTEFLRNDRALYGASGAYKSESSTSFGERKTQATAYAAQPGTIPQHDELRGTGGSAYFLKHQDISIGSETVAVEVRDHVTGAVLSRTPLVNGQDYDIDYIQGLILLKTPLASTSSGAAVIQSGALGSNDNVLVAAYEYTPAAAQVDGYVYGGRAQQWLGETVRVGVTGQTEKTAGADQKLFGADVQLRKSDRTFLEAEVARSQGPGFGLSSSADGGLTISNTATAGVEGKAADAFRVHGHAAIEELVDSSAKGDLDGYYEHVDGGFSSLQRQVTAGETNAGASAKVKMGENASASIMAKRHRSGDGTTAVAFTAQSDIAIYGNWVLSPAFTTSDVEQPSGLIDVGTRSDVGGKLLYKPDDTHSFYVFGQVTVAKTGTRVDNNRIGVGGATDITEKLNLSAEASTGSTGFGVAAKLDYKPTADDHYYLGYVLVPDRQFSKSFPTALNGADLGSIVAGSSHEYSKRLSVFNEARTDLYGSDRSLTQTYGVRYTPDALWSFGGGLEFGNIWDETINASTGLKNSDFDRKAFSGSIGYHDEDRIQGHAKGELRLENSQDHTRDMTSYLLQAGLSTKTSENWRMLAELSAVISEASDTTRSGAYLEGSLGYAYRPVDNDRLNALFKYTYVYDLPGADQVSVDGTTHGPAQMSSILSADASYDLNPYLTIGGKYGFRLGQTRDRAAGSPWVANSAHLAVLRLDVHVVKNWDALLESRALWSPETQSSQTAVLAAIYRQMGDNFKVGVGYNFGGISDDLRAINANTSGIFINAIGKF